MILDRLNISSDAKTVVHACNKNIIETVNIDSKAYERSIIDNIEYVYTLSREA